MPDLAGMLWVEARKALRSRLPLWTGLAALVLPLGIGFIIFVARNPQLSTQLGLISAKASLGGYASTDWPAYLAYSGLTLAAGGFFLFVLIISWVFGREFVDGTLKDMLAVPVGRASILLAKFIVSAVWSAAQSLVILAVALAMGALINLPGYSAAAIARGCAVLVLTAGLAIIAAMPFAFFASVGRGYLLPLGLALLMALLTNVVSLAGWGEYFPWAVPGLYAQSKTVLAPISYGILVVTGLAGMAATWWWWKVADQNR
jgi:ABC-2 type transport system permease protein